MSGRVDVRYESILALVWNLQTRPWIGSVMSILVDIKRINLIGTVNRGDASRSVDGVSMLVSTELILTYSNSTVEVIHEYESHYRLYRC